MSPALHRGVRKAIRTAVQVIASGGLTAAINVLAGGLSPNAKVLIGAGWLLVVTFAQNSLESAGKIPTLLPSPGLVTTVAGGAVAQVVGTVDAAADVVGGTVGDVTGVVSDLSGGLLGEVVGVEPETEEEGV